MKVVSRIIRTGALFIILILSTNIAYSQNDTLRIEPGTYALQFQIGSNFNLSNFQGSIISFKKHLSETDAIRIGLSGSFRNRSSERENNQTEQQYFNDELNFSFTIRSQYVRHKPTGVNNINYYYGAGPMFNFSYQDLENRSINESQVVHLEQISTTTQRNWVTGIGTVIGAEWFFTNRFSLAAEYGFILDYTHSFRENTATNISQGNEDIRVDELSNTAFSLSASGVRFGLTVYL